MEMSEIEKKDMSGALRDMYMLEFLDLPEPYKEHNLQKAILKNMKKFLLEFGKDFLFIDEEYHVQVVMKEYG
jgi:predicted nuclease of restriction endonuclease-like (RecB) superfamily